MNKWIGFLFNLILVLFISSCSVLPKTLNESNLIVVANYKWIGKIGKKTLSEGAAKPILKNYNTGEKFYPKYINKTFSYFYNLKEGKYIVDEIILDAGRAQLHIRAKDRSIPFEIGRSGTFFIGGIDIVDYQTRLEFKVHNDNQVQKDLDPIRNVLTTNASFPQETKITVIDNVLLREKWDTPGK